MRKHSNLDFQSPKKQSGKTKESHRYTTPSVRSGTVAQDTTISPNFIAFTDRRQSDHNNQIRANFKSVALQSPKLNNLTFYSPRKNSSRNVMIPMQPLSPQQ